MGNANSVVKIKNKNKNKKLKRKENYYIIKVDDVQIDRIQQQHHIFKSYCDTNFTSPISQDLRRGIEVLDVGSGPGTWMFDMSSEFQNSKFTGIEIQKFMLPTIHPSNTKFIHNDILQGIPLDPNSFDYIHMRCMTLCFTELQYENVVKNLVYLLKPNGYLELCEPQIYFYNMGPITRKLNDELNTLICSKSMNPALNNRLHEILENCGLQEIQRHDIMLPLSVLDGEIGLLYGETIFSAISGLKGQLAKQMKVSCTEIDDLLAKSFAETRSIKMYAKYTRVHGKKLSSI